MTCANESCWIESNNWKSVSPMLRSAPLPLNPDGSVSNIQVVRSLDPTFGLDQQAIEAARKWKFKPGTRLGQPVPVLVSIELTFTLR